MYVIIIHLKRPSPRTKNPLHLMYFALSSADLTTGIAAMLEGQGLLAYAQYPGSLRFTAPAFYLLVQVTITPFLVEINKHQTAVSEKWY